MSTRIIFASCLVGLSLSASPLRADAQLDECTKELVSVLFPSQFVLETLKKYNVPESERDAIVNELNDKNKEVITLVEEKASKIDPNPLKDPSQRLQAVKIFRETLYEVFAGVLKKHNITDDNQIQQMLKDVNDQKTTRFTQCAAKERASQ
ncbi:MAG: hypothetical protein ACK4HV_00465 [Parachlamydiaceae bacterium]